MRSSSIILVIVLFSLVSVISCESRQTGGGSKKASSAPDAPLFAPASSQARLQNDEGVGHYQQGIGMSRRGTLQERSRRIPNRQVLTTISLSHWTKWASRRRPLPRLRRL